MRVSTIIPYLLIILLFLSCDRIKKKGEVITDKARQKISNTEEKIKRKKDQLTDDVFPIYNSETSDTEFNKKRFSEHLQINLPPDVKDIYAYGDFLGIDYKVLLSFTCDSITINRIIEVKKMQRSKKENDVGLHFLDEFKWWNKDKIETLVPFKAGEEQVYWQYLWYDPKTKQAYYEEFSL